MLRVMVAAVFVTLAGWYSPGVTAAIWHLFHPSGHVEYRGLHVLVPWPWTADAEEDSADSSVTPEGISLKKMPYSIDRRLPAESLFVTVISPDASMSAAAQTDAWMNTFRATHPEADFDVKTPLAVPPGASCLSARSHGSHRGVVWTCISVEGGWVTNFAGNDADVAVFFELVKHLKR